MTISPEEVERFRQAHGSKMTATVLSTLGRRQVFYNVLTSEVGQILFEPAMHRMNELLLKISNESATLEDRAEYRALKYVTAQWIERIISYIKSVEKLKMS